jgi:hypothetical protein
MNNIHISRTAVPSRVLQRPRGASSAETIRSLFDELEEVIKRVDHLRRSVSVLLQLNSWPEGDQFRDVLHLQSRLEGIAQIVADAERYMERIGERCTAVEAGGQAAVKADASSLTPFISTLDPALV